MVTQIRLEFSTSPQTSPLQLSHFLQLYVTTYRALEKLLHNTSPDDLSGYEVPVRGLFGDLEYNDIKYCLDNTSFDGDPQITSINQQSPIEIVIAGSLGLLTIAAILSGGRQKIDLGPLKCEFHLNSLADSIENLKIALSRNSSLRTGYEFTGTRIKLSKEEYLYLNKKVNTNGGFQRFIRELQIRVKKRTRELELGNRDIEKILKYKSNPSKGGFQSRFDKIFGKHFS